MQRHEIDPDTYMRSMLTSVQQRGIPALIIYTVKENSKLMIRTLSFRTAAEIKVIWDTLHRVDDDMIENAAKALAAMDQVPWEQFGEEQKDQVRLIARTAIMAALRTHAPLPSPVTPALILPA